MHACDKPKTRGRGVKREREKKRNQSNIKCCFFFDLYVKKATFLIPFKAPLPSHHHHYVKCLMPPISQSQTVIKWMLLCNHVSNPLSAHTNSIKADNRAFPSLHIGLWTFRGTSFFFYTVSVEKWGEGGIRYYVLVFLVTCLLP